MAQAEEKRECLAFPSNKTMAHIANFKLSEYESLHTHKSPMLLSNDEQQQRMKISKDLIRTAIDDENTLFSDWAKAVNKARRILIKKEITLPPLGEKVKKLIDILQAKVIYRIKELEKSNYEAARQYVQGDIRMFLYETSTHALTKSMNRDSAFSKRGQGSFTGLGGYYAALRQLNFIFRKYNKSAVDGRETKKGTIVCLEINLDWIFGFFLAHTRGESATKMNTSNYLLTENMQLSGVFENLPTDSVENESLATANFKKPSIEAINIAKHIEAKREIRQQTVYMPNPREVLSCARRIVALLLGSIYSTANFATYKVRTNKETALKAMPTGNESIILSLMTENIKQLLNEGKNLGDCEDEISATIEAKRLYLERYEDKYVYPPVRFLDPDTKGGLLWILQKRREQPKEAFQKIQSVGDVAEKTSEATTLPTPSVPTPQTAKHSNISWFIAEGAYEYAVRARVKKWGKDAVSAAIALGRAKIARGFDPKSGKIPYIMGIIDRIESIEQIERDASEQIILHKNAIPFGTPKPKVKAKKEPIALDYSPTAIAEIALRKGYRIGAARATKWAERLKGKENAEVLLHAWIESDKQKINNKK